MRPLLLLVPLIAALPGCAGRSAAAAPPPGDAGSAQESVTAAVARAPSPATAAPSAAPTALASVLPASSTSADAGAPPAGPCPEGMALVQRFCIDKWEATLWAPGSDGAVIQIPPNRPPPEGVRFVARTLAGVMPQGYIDRIDAAAACKNAGKRLCSMHEWLRACEGRHGWHWPYGRKAVAGKCNHEKPHLLSIKFGSNPKRWKYEMFNDPSLDVEPGFLAKTGAYDGCTTPEDVHDLVGNLHEWVSDTVDEDLVERMDAEDIERHPQPWRDGNGIFMGGFFSTADQHGPGCTFTTIAHEPRYHDYSVGFRCCAAADLPPPPKKTPRKRHKK